MMVAGMDLLEPVLAMPERSDLANPPSTTRSAVTPWCGQTGPDFKVIIIIFFTIYTHIFFTILFSNYEVRGMTHLVAHLLGQHIKLLFCIHT